MTTHASESQHWYSRDGSPAYEVPDAKGKMRPATLRDARKLGLVPSVTTIIKCAAAPQLEVWKQKQVMLAALTLPRVGGESDESFCERVMKDSKEQSRKAAERGTAIHAAIQGHFDGEPPHPDFWPHVQAVKECLAQNCAVVTWQAEQSFCSPLGFGGKSDLRSAEGSSWVLDFKSKEFTKDEAPTLKTWDEHAMQLAAYRHGLHVLHAACGIVYVSSLEPGVVRLIEIDEADLKRGWFMFLGLLDYWKHKTGYYPERWNDVQEPEAA